MKTVKYMASIILMIAIFSSLIIAGEKQSKEKEFLTIAQPKSDITLQYSNVIETKEPLKTLQEVTEFTTHDIVLVSDLKNENWVEYENPVFEGRIILVCDEISSSKTKALRKMFPSAIAIVQYQN